MPYLFTHRSFPPRFLHKLASSTPGTHLSTPFAPLDLGWELHLLAPHTFMRGIWGAFGGSSWPGTELPLVGTLLGSSTEYYYQRV